MPFHRLKTFIHRHRSQTPLPPHFEFPELPLPPPPLPFRHSRPPHLRRPRPLLWRFPSSPPISPTSSSPPPFLLRRLPPLPPPRLASDPQLQLIFFAQFTASFLTFVSFFNICCGHHSWWCGRVGCSGLKKGMAFDLLLHVEELLLIGDDNQNQQLHISGPHIELKKIETPKKRNTVNIPSEEKAVLPEFSHVKGVNGPNQTLGVYMVSAETFKGIFAPLP